MKQIYALGRPPVVRLLGDVDHADFREAHEVLRAQAQLVHAGTTPELIVLAQSRPGALAESAVEQLRRTAPLAGMVGLLGSWCEGETRTGRAWPGVTRLYWYEFPCWWRRQLELLAGGRCPDWAHPLGAPAHFALSAKPDLPAAVTAQRAATISCGVIVISTSYRGTAEGLTDVFRPAGYATIWQQPGRPSGTVRGATAGIWDGGQLDAREAEDLARFCRMLSGDAAPVLAILDFPRRDRVDLALQLGAAAVLGKPWHNKALLDEVQQIAQGRDTASAA